jgi:hypothetical protein
MIKQKVKLTHHAEQEGSGWITATYMIPSPMMKIKP